MLSSRATLAVVAALMALSVAGASSKPSAAATDDEIGAAFNEADLNGDGFLEIDEYVGYIVQVFASVDKNRDGFLVAKDIPGASPERFALFDRDKDGRISLGEGVGGKVVEFFDADVNDDGVMSLAELLDFERNQKVS